VSALVPLRIVRDAWWLALVVIAVLQEVHAGLHEHRELSPVVHVLRDAALAVPAAALAIVAASVIVAARTVAPVVPRPPGAADRLLWVLVAAFVFAVLSVPGNELHGALFGAEDEAELSWLADVALDAGIALIGAFFALLPLAVVAGVPVRDPATHVTRSIDRPRPVLETSARSSQ
jgi:hypothetical protein